jgi:hypothetical protein
LEDELTASKLAHQSSLKDLSDSQSKVQTLTSDNLLIKSKLQKLLHKQSVEEPVLLDFEKSVIQLNLDLT